MSRFPRQPSAQINWPSPAAIALLVATTDALMENRCEQCHYDDWCPGACTCLYCRCDY